MSNQFTVFFSNQSQFRNIIAVAAQLIDKILFFTVCNFCCLKSNFNQIIYLRKFFRCFSSDNHFYYPFCYMGSSIILIIFLNSYYNESENLTDTLLPNQGFTHQIY